MSKTDDGGSFTEDCFNVRDAISNIKVATLDLKKHDALHMTGVQERDKCEMIANIELAYRHLEDARMRLGKAIQAFDGGESCYPR